MGNIFIALNFSNSTPQQEDSFKGWILKYKLLHQALKVITIFSMNGMHNNKYAAKFIDKSVPG